MVGPNGFEYDAYLVMLADPFFAEHSASQFAEELGVSTTTIYKWNKKVDWESIKATRRKNYAKQTLGVDSSLLKATRKLDVAAIRTWYERFDSWVPTSKQQTEHSVSDKEVDEALNALIERKRAALAALDASGRGDASVNPAGEVKAGEGGADAVLPAQPGAIPVHSGDSAGGPIHRD